MKNYAIILTALSLASQCSLHAQTVPLIINYQGQVTGGTGIPVGSTGTAPNFIAAPENRKIIFRIFDAQTGGTRLWSEQHTATISLGEFSVLLGQGIDAVYDAVTESRPALDTVFTGGGAVTPAGPVRYLEIVVDDGNGTFTSGADVPVTPRQRITTSAYSFRSRIADTVPNLAIATPALADGAVTAAKVADNSITSLKILDGSVTTAKIPDGSVTTAKVADNSITSLKILDGSVSAAKLDPGIGVWSTQGGNVYRASGRVGVGTTSPGAPVQVNLPTSGRTSEALRLTGGPDAVNGPALLLGVNIPNNREIWIGDTARINNNSDNAQIRLGLLANSLGCNYIDSMDNGITKNLAFCPVGGLVGINTLFPSQATLHVEGSGFFSEQLMAESFTLWSDARIKSIVGRSNPHSDLESIRKLQVTDYRLIGGKTPGNTVQKGFIAQEVQQIVPEAVKKLEKRSIPSINAPARTATFDPGAKTMGIVLEKAHGLKKGDTVQVSDDKRSWDLLVSETPDATSFVAGPVEAPILDVFVYGKVVDDFLAVDYNRLFTTGIGAIQDLAKQVEAIKAENAELRTRLAASERRFAELEAADKARDERLVTIEKLLITAGKGTARTTSRKDGK